MITIGGNFNKSGDELIITIVASYLQFSGKGDRLLALLTQLPYLSRILSAHTGNDAGSLILSEQEAIGIDRLLAQVARPIDPARISEIENRDAYDDAIVDAAIGAVEIRLNDHRDKPYNEAVLFQCRKLTTILTLIPTFPE